MATKRHIVLVETLSGIETIKSVNAEPVMQREWEKAVADASRVNGRMRIWSGFAANSTILIQQIVSVTIIVWGVFLVSEGQVSIGGLIAANILARAGSGAPWDDRANDPASTVRDKVSARAEQFHEAAGRPIAIHLP